MLDWWYAVLALVVSGSYQDGFSFHSYEHAVFLVYRDPAFVKMNIVPLSAVFPTLINECGNSVNVSAVRADLDIVWNGSCVVNFALHVLPFAKFTVLLDLHRIGSCAHLWSSLLM